MDDKKEIEIAKDLNLIGKELLDATIAVNDALVILIDVTKHVANVVDKVLVDK